MHGLRKAPFKFSEESYSSKTYGPEILKTVDACRTKYIQTMFTSGS